jgi:hypothetical protein
MKKTVLIFLFVIVGSIVSAQNYKDIIVTSLNDTIPCHISLINPQQIYYTTLINGKVVSTYKTISEIKHYEVSPDNSPAIITAEKMQEVKQRDSVAQANTIPYDYSILKKSGWGNGFTQNKEDLKWKDLKQILEQIPAADQKIENIGALQVAGVVTGFVGGYCLGYYTVGSLRNINKPSDIYLAAGGVGVGLAILCQVLIDKQIAKAVEIYNNEHAKSSAINPVEVQFGFQSAGLGFRLKF